MRRRDTSRAWAFSAAVTVREPRPWPRSLLVGGASKGLLRFGSSRARGRGTLCNITEVTSITRIAGSLIPVAAAHRDLAGGPGSDGDETLSEAFMSVARRLRGTSQETLAPWEITPAQLRALRVLSHHGMQRMSELSDHLRIAARSATEVVEALESRGLVERRPDPADR